MKNINLFLDDLRMPNMAHSKGRNLGEYYSNENEWVIVRDYFSFIEVIKNEFDNIELISFDHDLACYSGDKEYTGKDAANFVIDYCLENNKKFPSWYVHSDNTAGKQNIINFILSYMKNIEEFDISNFRYFHNGILNNRPV